MIVVANHWRVVDELLFSMVFLAGEDYFQIIYRPLEEYSGHMWLGPFVKA
jgi:hypothetical protein